MKIRGAITIRLGKNAGAPTPHDTALDRGMTITTWNVNSVRARLERMLLWLDAHEPDVLCLQELKCVEDEVPHAELARRGYQVAAYGQKTYNGVLIASRAPMSDVQKAIPWPEDPQARGISAVINGIRIVNLYVVNGQEVGSEKYAYKLEWLGRLRDRLGEHAGESMVVCGDYNIAPDDRDVHDPAYWNGKILCSDAERTAFTSLLGLGLTDAYRARHAEGGRFSWWDYRGNGFERNLGLRIDHHLVTADVLARTTEVSIDTEERSRANASDHAPVTLHLTGNA